MARSISASTMMEWTTYFSMEPFGEERADMRIAQLDAIIANSNRDPAKRPSPYQMRDFMFEFDKKPETEADKLNRMIAAGKILAATAGGIFRKGGDA